MLSFTQTAILHGAVPTIITVEVSICQGKPQLTIIGLASKTVSESKERITMALISSGVRPKAKKTIVNLAPAGIKKNSTSFDLAIAVGILATYSLISFSTEKILFLGELSLDGSVKKVRGILPLILHAKKMGITQACIPLENITELDLVKNFSFYGITHLSELIKKKSLQFTSFKTKENCPEKIPTINANAIMGHAFAKRALQVALSGGHHLLLLGPPGGGKSLLAQAAGGLLPKLSQAEILEVLSLYSIANAKPSSLPPFRSPSHSSSVTTLIGGGNLLLPGEITLAHKGVLFLDELAEFSRASLESLREPLENHSVCLSRISDSATYPCDFTLIAASNPCPCGFWGSPTTRCVCSQYKRNEYIHKISGPILDRIDMHIFITPISSAELCSKETDSQKTMADAQNIVVKAREKQLSRQKMLNKSLDMAAIQEFEIESAARKLVRQATEKLGLSTRGYLKLMRVSKTIADLAERNHIVSDDVAEALQYRTTV